VKFVSHCLMVWFVRFLLAYPLPAGRVLFSLDSINHWIQAKASGAFLSRPYWQTNIL
jgi:hypothetical protein